MNKNKYTIEEKMSGLDLHGLSCRVPEPVGAQKACTHTEGKWVVDEWEDCDGNVQSEEKYESVSAYEDIEGTNNIRCTKCGYTRRY